MKCPVCGSVDTAVKDSRPTRCGIRRRRKCSAGHRFTTHELPAHMSVDDGLTNLTDLVERIGDAYRIGEKIKAAVLDLSGGAK